MLKYTALPGLWQIQIFEYRINTRNQKCKMMEGRKDGQTDSQTDRQAGRDKTQTDRRTDAGWTDVHECTPGLQHTGVTANGQLQNS